MTPMTTPIQNRTCRAGMSGEGQHNENETKNDGGVHPFPGLLERDGEPVP